MLCNILFHIAIARSMWDRTDCEGFWTTQQSVTNAGSPGRRAVHSRVRGHVRGDIEVSRHLVGWAAIHIIFVTLAGQAVNNVTFI